MIPTERSEVQSGSGRQPAVSIARPPRRLGSAPSLLLLAVKVTTGAKAGTQAWAEVQTDQPPGRWAICRTRRPGFARSAARPLASYIEGRKRPSRIAFRPIARHAPIKLIRRFSPLAAFPANHALDQSG